ncbi:MAG: hypothetical protein HY749_10520 [Gammaproteobacteria bacterium]|nr:hypothetical protein [Gammaproteobacteria bacterium]
MKSFLKIAFGVLLLCVSVLAAVVTFCGAMFVSESSGGNGMIGLLVAAALTAVGAYIGGAALLTSRSRKDAGAASQALGHGNDKPPSKGQ